MTAEPPRRSPRPTRRARLTALAGLLAAACWLSGCASARQTAPPATAAVTATTPPAAATQATAAVGGYPYPGPAVQPSATQPVTDAYPPAEPGGEAAPPLAQATAYPPAEGSPSGPTELPPAEGYPAGPTSTSAAPLATAPATLPPTPPRPAGSPTPPPTPRPTQRQLTPVIATPRTAQGTPQSNAGCDQARLVGHINVPDGFAFTTGTQFIKTWRIQNTGACAWTANYALVFDSGSPMDGPTIQKLGAPVAPGGSVDISVVLTAPGQPGRFTAAYKLRNAAGAVFGLGVDRTQALTTTIQVTPDPLAGPGYDFTDDECAAEWFANNLPTACLGTDANPRGFIRRLSAPILETGHVDDEPALLVQPPWDGGVLYGRYPAYPVGRGDQFTATLGCQRFNQKCAVRFRLDYQIDNGPVQTLAAWDEIYDGEIHPVSVDLSPLVGKNVQFILTVLAQTPSDQNRALWLHPQIIP